MKSLVRTAPPAQAQAQVEVALPKSEQAQCCAKISKTVAGCHD
jgi:hypothetical protein